MSRFRFKSTDRRIDAPKNKASDGPQPAEAFY